MKTDWFKLRMPVITLLFSLAAVLLLMIPSLKPNASAGTPQGKGGEVIAKPKPTPTPKKSPPPARTNRISRRTLPRTYTNQVGIEFVLNSAGRFMMGSTKWAETERPVHEVTIRRAFYMGKYEVTQGQWQALMGSNPSYFKDCGDNCPVERVSWNDAQKFIYKLNEAHDGYKYRLPSEAEWEYSCRAGTTGDFYSSDVNDIGWYWDNSGEETHTVGEKQPNAFGLYDMSGNVWEWCSDIYHKNYVGAPTDGSAWVSGGETTHHVFRGGSFRQKGTFIRSANRDSSDGNWNELGFRVVAVVWNK